MTTSERDPNALVDSNTQAETLVIGQRFSLKNFEGDKIIVTLWLPSAAEGNVAYYSAQRKGNYWIILS